MRPSRPADQWPIADLIHVRSGWMRQRGMPDWSEAAEDLSAQAAHPDTRVWVCRGSIEPDLVRYYRDVQGWRVVRQIDRDGHTVVGLARRATLMPDLAINPIPIANRR